MSAVYTKTDHGLIETREYVAICSAKNSIEHLPFDWYLPGCVSYSNHEK